MDRKSVNVVAVFTVEPADYDISRQSRGADGAALLRECCARADLIMMAVCDDAAGVLSAIRSRASHTASEGSRYDLTPHELRLLGLLVEGYTYKAAATALGISVNTVAFHIQNIYGKMAVHSKAEAVARALNEGLLLSRAS